MPRAALSRRQLLPSPPTASPYYLLAAWIARHTLSRVSGMSMCVTPSGESASITAFTNAAGDPTFGLSPTPFAPIGWCGLGVQVLDVSQCGVSSDVGTKYSVKLVLRLL